ncbi:MAG: hypothetical protein FJ100_12030 [Deltaproteobacteria bacterium]|nr:hypothetical protein [Deltaproteobacteria bacterium]
MAGSPAGAPITFDPQAAEVRGLRLGTREAWRLRVRPSELDPFRRAVCHDGLHLAVTDRPWTAHVGGQIVPHPQPSGQVALVAVVAGDPAAAQQCLDWESELHRLDGSGGAWAATARMVALHRCLGAAYGYPACCVEAFCDAFVEVVTTDRSGDNPVAIARAAWRSRTFDPLLDTLTVALGERNATPLRHLPCRFDCPSSLGLADRLLTGRRAHGPVPRTVIVLAGGEMLVVPAVAEPARPRGWHVATTAEAAQIHGSSPAAFALRDGLRADRWSDLLVQAGRGLFGRRSGRRWRIAEPGGGTAGHLFPAVLAFGARSEVDRSGEPAPVPAKQDCQHQAE